MIRGVGIGVLSVVVIQRVVNVKKRGADAMVGIGRVYDRLELMFCEWHGDVACCIVFIMFDCSGIRCDQ